MSRAARRAGKIAAMIPTTIAATAKMISCVTGRVKSMKSIAGHQQGPERDPEQDSEDAADRRRDDALVSDHAPNLTARHADGAQHADLPGPLEHREHERVHDPEEADENREREQDVEDVEHGVQS